MLHGQMMQMPLLIASLIQHADRHHGDVEVVSRRVEGDLHRYTYRDVHRRARQVANVLDTLGVKRSDRIATLAWNGHRHLELYYGVSGIGGGPAHDQPPPAPGTDRLDRQSRRRPVPVLRPDLPADHRGDRAALPHHPRLRGDDRPRAHARVQARAAVLRGPRRPALGPLRLAGVRRKPRLVACATRRARPATRRASSTATARPCCTRSRRRCPTRSTCRRATRSCRSCRCSTSMPGACRTPADGRRQARLPGPKLDGQVALRAVRRREGDLLGRRADRLAGAAGAHGGRTACASRRCAAPSSAARPARRR